VENNCAVFFVSLSSLSTVSFTFQEVLSGDQALVVLAEARGAVQQEVGALVLVDPEQDLSVFEVA